jgi:hypothetical protein
MPSIGPYLSRLIGRFTGTKRSDGGIFSLSRQKWISGGDQGGGIDLLHQFRRRGCTPASNDVSGSFYPLHDNRLFFILDLQSTTIACLVDRHFWMKRIEIGIVVDCLLPDLSIVELENRRSVPPMNVPAYGRFDCRHAANLWRSEWLCCGRRLSLYRHFALVHNS